MDIVKHYLDLTGFRLQCESKTSVDRVLKLCHAIFLGGWVELGTRWGVSTSLIVTDTCVHLYFHVDIIKNNYVDLISFR